LTVKKMMITVLALPPMATADLAGQSRECSVCREDTRMSGRKVQAMNNDRQALVLGGAMCRKSSPARCDQKQIQFKERFRNVTHGQK
jgi:hypothetical protein